ncbi:MAG TPA: NAD(P)-dependent oxidoreductase [Spirillospora sp.]|nr:NAD(P)-dependent oxidoreductase [Spirillospora sp.]
MYKVWVGVNMPDDVFAMLEEEVEVIGPRSDPTPPDSIEGVEEADAAIICPIFPANMATFEKLPRLRVVTRTGAGYDNVDVSAATACGICVVRTPDSNTESTAVYTIGMMLNAVRRIKLGDRLLARGEWLPLPQVDSFDLNGAMLGIIGLGRIGGRVAEIAHVLGMRVIAYDPYIDEGRAVSLRTRLVPELHTLLNEADVVTLHVPVTDETRGMINATTLSQMKDGAVLVNCARGQVVVETALVDALRSGKLAGAALDVWDPEPPAPDNPLLHMDNVITTPHMAAKTYEGQRRSRSSGAQQTIMALKGLRPSGLVNPEVWDRRRGLA